MEIRKIRTARAIEHFGTQAEMARIMGVKPQAITKWGEFIPELRAYKLRENYPREFQYLVEE